MPTSLTNIDNPLPPLTPPAYVPHPISIFLDGNPTLFENDFNRILTNQFIVFPVKTLAKLQKFATILPASQDDARCLI